MGQRLTGRFICLIGGRPQLPSQGDGIIVERREGGGAHARTEIAVLFVVTHTHDYAYGPGMKALVFPQSSERRFGFILLDVREPVLDEIRRWNIVHFEFQF